MKFCSVPMKEEKEYRLGENMNEEIWTCAEKFITCIF